MPRRSAKRIGGLALSAREVRLAGLTFAPNELRLGEPCGHCICLSRRVPAKRFAYVVKNADPTPKFYVGLTPEVDARIADHNMGRCPHTASRRPWRRHVVIEFADEDTAFDLSAI
jgi:hypothetical protein